MLLLLQQVSLFVWREECTGEPNTRDTRARMVRGELRKRVLHWAIDNNKLSPMIHLIQLTTQNTGQISSAISHGTLVHGDEAVDGIERDMLGELSEYPKHAFIQVLSNLSR